jgi:uncharacterized protein with HEPN domain
MAERDEQLYLTEILEAADRAIRYCADGRGAFFADQKTQDAVVRNIEIIGEASKQLSPTTRAARPDIPWSKIAGTRDRLIHGYYRVDLEIIWEIVESELPRLREAVAGLLPKP